MGIWVVKLSLNIRKDRQWTVEQIGSWEGLGGRKGGGSCFREILAKAVNDRR